MIGRVIPFLLAILFTGVCEAQLPDGFAKGARKPFEYGLRPPLSVFDPTGVLLPEEAKEISDQLAEVFRTEGVDIIVVVLADVGKAPPEHVARTFAKEWCLSPIHGVVLHVPGHDSSPWIVPEGSLIASFDPEQVKLAVEKGQRRAAAEAKDIDKVKAAATEATDMLRFWLSDAIKSRQANDLEFAGKAAQEEASWRKWKIGAMIVAASTLMIALGGFLIFAIRRRRVPCYFGLPTIKRRLGAPHAGGNHAVVDLGPKKS